MRASTRGKPRGLSKSKLLASLQCAKRLWLETHRPEAAETSPAAEQRFKAGHEVGEIARRLAGNGVLIGAEKDLPVALAETSTQIVAGAKVLFEPAFRHGGVLVRADIVKRNRSGYRVREVKSSTSVKDYHLQDAAIQAWVLNGAGIKVESVAIQHLNGKFVYPGNEDYRGLFTEEAVDGEIRPLLKDVPKWVAAAQATLAGAEPDVRTGKHCHTPYDCPCYEYCAAQEPQTEYPLTVLPNVGRTLLRLTEEGYRDVREIPPGRLTSETQERVRRITRSGRRELSAQSNRAMRKLPYPRYYLDFETIGFPVPVWAGTRPHQQLPFQWSCHVERSPGKIDRYLDDSPHDDEARETLLDHAERDLIVELEESKSIALVGRFDGVNARDREAHRRNFNRRHNPFVLLVGQVGEEGIDLQEQCRYVIHYDLEWNPARMEQREGRVDRMGWGRASEGFIDVRFLLLNGTYEERIFHTVMQRDQWFQILIGSKRKELGLLPEEVDEEVEQDRIADKDFEGRITDAEKVRVMLDLRPEQ